MRKRGWRRQLGIGRETKTKVIGVGSGTERSRQVERRVRIEQTTGGRRVDVSCGAEVEHSRLSRENKYELILDKMRMKGKEDGVIFEWSVLLPPVRRLKRANKE